MNFKHGDIIIIDNKQIVEVGSVNNCTAYLGKAAPLGCEERGCTGYYVRSTRAYDEWCLIKGRDIRKATDREAFLYHLGISEIEAI